jgi:outer membrane autotransporter protein
MKTIYASLLLVALLPLCGRAQLTSASFNESLDLPSFSSGPRIVAANNQPLPFTLTSANQVSNPSNWQNMLNATLSNSGLITLQGDGANDYQTITLTLSNIMGKQVTGISLLTQNAVTASGGSTPVLTYSVSGGVVTINFVDSLIGSGDSFNITTGLSTFGSLTLQGYNLTPNQQSVANSLNKAILGGSTNGDLLSLVASAQLQPNLGVALDELSPQRLQIFREMAFGNFGFAANQLDDHLASLRDGLSGFDTSGLEVLNSSESPLMAQIRGRLLAYNPAPMERGVISDSAQSVLGGVETSDAKSMEGVTPVTDNNRWITFISGNVVLANTSRDPGISNANYTTSGVTAGADFRLDEHWTVGALMSYGNTTADLDGSGSDARVDSYSPGIYASYADHGWYANGLFAYNYNTYGEDRTIAFLGRTANGSSSGNQFDGNLDGGYEFHHGAWTFGPTAALQFVHLDINGFNETGAGVANLTISDQDADSLRSRLGGEVRYHGSWYGGKVSVVPHAGVSWQHEYLDGSSGITSQFNGIGSGSFVVNTSSPDRDAAFVDVGVDTQWNESFGLFVDYETQAGQSDFFAQSVEGGAKVSF